MLIDKRFENHSEVRVETPFETPSDTYYSE
jgi:hypothetical protein